MTILIIALSLFSLLQIALLIYVLIKYNKIIDKVSELEDKVDQFENDILKYQNKDFWQKNFITK